MKTFKKGDKVIIKDRNTATGIMADMIGDLEEGLISYRTIIAADTALLSGNPVEIHSEESGGYILAIKGKPFSGIISAYDLKPA